MTARLMISIWSVMSGKGPNQQEMQQQGFILAGAIILNLLLFILKNKQANNREMLL
jgi:hypothetical protein